MLKWICAFFACLMCWACSTNKQGAQSIVNVSPSGNDLTTDEGVLSELERIHQKKFAKEYVCIERPVEFPGLVLVAMFANDRGCMGDEAFFRGEFGGIGTRSADILEQAGWKKSNSERERLAKAWFNKVHCVWRSPLTSHPEEIPQDVWFPQQVLVQDEKYIVKGWIQQPSGMRPQAVFRAEEIQFNKQGAILSVKILREFIHEF